MWNTNVVQVDLLSTNPLDTRCGELVATLRYQSDCIQALSNKTQSKRIEFAMECTLTLWKFRVIYKLSFIEIHLTKDFELKSPNKSPSPPLQILINKTAWLKPSLHHNIFEAKIICLIRLELDKNAAF